MAVAGKTKKDVVLEFRTTEILDAARAVFALKGFQGATIDNIASVAGVAKGTVYLYFDSKRELFLASLRDGVQALHAEVTAEMQAAETSEAKIHAFIAGRFNYFSRNREFLRIYYTEFAHLITGAANVQPELRDLYEAQAALLESALADGIEAGQLRPFAVPQTARLIYDLIRTAIAQRILNSTDESPDESIQTLHDIVWKGIGN